MVVGSGLLANAFLEYEKDDGIVIFASGVSNSKETSPEQFLREKKLLNFYLDKYGVSKYFIYFSTCSIYDTYFEGSAYIEHKIKMEQLIEEKTNRYNIFRLPQVLGQNNKNQLVGFLFDAIKNDFFFNLYNIERNIVDIEDIFLIIHNILKNNILKNKIINIGNPKNIKVIDLVSIIEKIINKKGKYTIEEKDGKFNIDIKNIEFIIHKFNIFEENYLNNRIKKYYE